MTDALHSLPFRSRAARAVGLAVALIDLFVLAMAWRTLRTDRQLQYDRAAQSSANLARVLAENLEGNISQIALALEACAHSLEEPGETGRRRTGEIIDRIAARIPLLDAIRVTDADGVVVLGTAVDPSARVSLADRDYFRRARSQPDGAMVISSPLVGRISGKWSIVFARAFRDGRGAFRGIVYAAVTLDRFTHAFANLQITGEATVVLRGADNAVIARFPEAEGGERIIGYRQVTPSLERILASPLTETTFVAVSPIDHREKVNAFRRIAGAPFYLLVAASTDAFLAGWRAEVQRTLAALALFLLATAVAAWAMLGSLRREGDARFRALVQEAPISVVLLRGTQTAYVNRTFLSTFQLEGRPARAGSFVDCVQATEAPRLLERLDRRVSGLEVEPTIELGLLRGDGTPFRATITDACVEVGGGPAVVAFIQDVTDRRRAEEERERLIRDLQSALADVKTLSGLLPICAHCKKIRDDRGYWSRIETFIRERSNAEFTHGICPDCARAFFGEGDVEDRKV